MSHSSSTEPLNLFEEIGGLEKIQELVDRFYDLMEMEERFTDLRRLHPNNLDISREKLLMFLSGWMGGPSLYMEKYGHPMLRAKHLPFPIGVNERDQWLHCMGQSMVDVGITNDLWERLLKSFFDTADWMRNKYEVGTDAS